MILVSHIASLFLFRRDFLENSHTSSITLIIPAAVIFIDAVYEKEFSNIASSIITIFYMVSMGARGP